MKTIDLITVSGNDDGTYGVLVYNDVPLNFRTLERPWRENQNNVSSIPAGSYLVRRTVTPLHGQTWEITNVPGRTAVLIHAGNTEIDVEGCVMLGIEAGHIDKEDPDTHRVERQPAVLRSKEAMINFNALLATENAFTLNVVRRP